MIFVSTACLKGENTKFTPDVFKVLEAYKEIGIRNIELGSVHSFVKNLGPLFEYQKQTDANFLIHCFFPPAKMPFMLNLASQNPKILESSIRIAKNAIELCRKLDSELYSVHGGHIADINIRDEPISKLVPLKQAFETAVNSLTILCDYAAKYNVNIAVENHRGRNDSSIFYNQDSFLELFKEVNMKNLGLLFDTGHLNIASNHYNFDKKTFIKKLQKHIFGIHVHENDGIKDNHLNITNKEILADFDKETLKKAALTLEANRLNKEEILEGKTILEEAVK